HARLRLKLKSCMQLLRLATPAMPKGFHFRGNKPKLCFVQMSSIDIGIPNEIEWIPFFIWVEIARRNIVYPDFFGYQIAIAAIQNLALKKNNGLANSAFAYRFPQLIFRRAVHEWEDICIWMELKFVRHFLSLPLPTRGPVVGLARLSRDGRVQERTLMGRAAHPNDA